MSNVIFSFFSGSGFLDLGFEKNGFEVAYVNEFHTPFLEAYKHSRKVMNIAEPDYGYDNISIEEINNSKDKIKTLKDQVKEKKGNDIIGFIGGPPCPDFSVGGKNKGKEGENGKLTQTYCDVVCKVKPDFFVFENVKGLWRTKRHKEFYETIKLQFEAAGFVLFDRLTNCIEFGAPQDRDRIILFGFQKSLLSSKGIKGAVSLAKKLNWDAHITHCKKEVFDYNWPITDKYIEFDNKPLPKNIPVELTIKYWFEKNDVYNHPNSKHHFTPRAALPKFQTIDEGDTSKKSFKRLHRWRYSPTAAYGNNEVHIHPYQARRLSAAEALAIQSLPKEFQLPADMSLSNMFKTIGNGVPYVMSEGLAKIIHDFIALPTKP